MFAKADIEKYFREEKSQGLFFLVIGIVALFTAIYFLVVLRTPCYTGAAFPFGLFGVIFSIVGYTVYKKSDDDRVRNVYAYDMDPAYLQNVELPRMNKVMTNFRYYRNAMMFCVLIGMVQVLRFWNDITKQYWVSVGAGMVIMSIFGLVADYFAAKRGRIYIKGLQSFTSKI